MVAAFATNIFFQLKAQIDEDILINVLHIVREFRKATTKTCCALMATSHPCLADGDLDPCREFGALVHNASCSREYVQEPDIVASPCQGSTDLVVTGRQMVASCSRYRSQELGSSAAKCTIVIVWGSSLDPVPTTHCCLVVCAQQVRGELERHSKFAGVVLRRRKGALAPKADRASANQSEGWGQRGQQPG